FPQRKPRAGRGVPGARAERRARPHPTRSGIVGLMQVLLDENVPRKLKFRLAPEHEATTVHEQGWAGLLNGALLDAADAAFDPFRTLDRRMEYQQHLGGLSLRIVVVRAASNTYEACSRWCLPSRPLWHAPDRAPSPTWPASRLTV